MYENQDFGYGGINDTYQKAHAIDPTIRRVDVKNYLDKLTHRQTQFKHKGQNSFVSPQPVFEFEVDLIDLTNVAKENNGFRYGFVAIDNFTKYAWCIPMKEKDATFCMPAFKKIIEIMGAPKQVYSDQEGAFTDNRWVKIIDGLKIRHIFANTAHSVERFNRTLKNMTVLKIKALNKEEQFKWVDALQDTLNKYKITYQRFITFIYKMYSIKYKHQTNIQFI